MSIRICEVCGKQIPDDAAFCTNCGAEQHGETRLTKIPETIEELRAFCAAHRITPEKQRFFIGEDYRGARAFGIYRDEAGNCVVYKNKADGSRSVRYSGPDEKRAVRELYEKLKSETELRRETPRQAVPERGAPEPEDDGEPVKLWQIVAGSLVCFWKPILIVLLIVVATRWAMRTPDRGYYRYQDDTYYYQDSGWYLYNAVLNDWERAYDVPEDLREDYGDYYESREDGGYGVPEFSYSSGYEDDDRDSDSFWDDWGDSGSLWDDYDWDDYDWDDDWDSWDTDWDSDW